MVYAITTDSIEVKIIKVLGSLISGGGKFIVRLGDSTVFFGSLFSIFFNRIFGFNLR